MRTAADCCADICTSIVLLKFTMQYLDVREYGAQAVSVGLIYGLAVNDRMQHARA